MNLFNNIYKGKKVLVTGHTGFKGSWLAIWLLELGAEVIGYALDPYTGKDNFEMSKLSSKLIDVRADLRDRVKLHETFKIHKPDYVFHLAAQPLVGLSYDIPVETYEVNVMGTINVLEEIRQSESVKFGIFITTDKCYDNKEQLYGYRETDALGGYDPYSSSKGACEIAINSWRNSFFNLKEFDKHRKAIASVRAGNVIGGGDWAKNRIIPDCIRALESNDKKIAIRNPQSVRPWQHVLEPLSGYLLLGQKLLGDSKKYAEAWNFGPNLESIIPVWDIAYKVINYYGEGKLVDKSESKSFHEANLLALDISKARLKLGWTPRLNIDYTIKLTVDWYKNYRQENVYELCLKQIEHFNQYGQ